MATTTNQVISSKDGWVEIASDQDFVRVKANSGNWKSWRIYFSESGSPSENNVGELYNGNKDVEFRNYTGSLYLLVEYNENGDSKTIDFSITTQSTI